MNAGAADQAQRIGSSRGTTSCTSVEFSEASEALSALAGVARTQYLQTQPGLLAAQFTRIDLTDLHLQVASMLGSTAYQCTPHPGIDVIILPLRWSDEMRWNGELIERPTLLRYTDYFARTATDIEVIGIGFARGRFEKAAAALAGVDRAELAIPCGPLSSDERYAARLMSTLETIEGFATQSCRLFEKTSFRRAVRDLLFDQIVDLYAHASAHTDAAVRHRSRSLRYVRLAEERFESASGRRVSIGDLCEAAGVSTRTLQYAFRKIYGMTPVQYFKARRLNRVRNALRKAKPERGAVKRAALEAGATELGRFSVEYRSFFGESPSTTLTRQAS